jgi:hypothetical protein
MAHKRKDSGTKQVLMALAENFERLAELATEEQVELTSAAAASP